jgi:small conductance mechanosensitive channel
VGNRSQLWAVALLDVGIAYGQDVERATGVIADTARGLYEDPDWSNLILEEPQVLGVQALGADGVTLRLSVKTEPAEQFAVERELRLRIKQAFDDAGIEIPFAQRTVWVRRDGTLAEPDDLAGPTE